MVLADRLAQQQIAAAESLREAVEDAARATREHAEELEKSRLQANRAQARRVNWVTIFAAIVGGIIGALATTILPLLGSL